MNTTTTDSLSPSSMSTVSTLSVELLESLDESGVLYVHWKSNIHLKEALSGETDLDLLVDVQGREIFAKAVSNVGFLPIQSQPWATYGLEDWIGFDSATGALLHLHVHFKVITGLKRVKHLHLPWEDKILESRVRHPELNWPIPAVEMEFLLLLVRIWAKMPPLRRNLLSYSLPRHIIDEFNFLNQRLNKDKFLALVRHYQLSLPDDIEEIFEDFQKSDEKKIVGVSRYIYYQLKAYYSCSWQTALLKAFYKGLQQLAKKEAQRFSNLVVYRKTFSSGITIALIGPDGAGKSRLTSDLKNWLIYKMDAHLVYMGSGDGNTGIINKCRLSFLNMVKKDNDKKIHESSKKKNASLAQKIYRLFDLLLIFRKHKLILKANKLRRNGSVIFFDRFPQDQYEAVNDGPRLQKGRGFHWAALLEKKIFDDIKKNEPDLIIKLKISPEDAHARKRDHSIEEIKAKCEIIDNLKFNNSLIVTVDAADAYGSVLRATQKAVWSLINLKNKRSHSL